MKKHYLFIFSGIISFLSGCSEKQDDSIKTISVDIKQSTDIVIDKNNAQYISLENNTKAFQRYISNILHKRHINHLWL